MQLGFRLLRDCTGFELWVSGCILRDCAIFGQLGFALPGFAKLVQPTRHLYGGRTYHSYGTNGPLSVGRVPIPGIQPPFLVLVQYFPTPPPFQQSLLIDPICGRDAADTRTLTDAEERIEVAVRHGEAATEFIDQDRAQTEPLSVGVSRQNVR